MNTYLAGSQINLQATFTNSTGGGTDPTAVRLLYRNSTGGVTALETTGLTTGASNGVWSYALTVSSTERTGVWWYRFVGTGAVIAAGEETLKVLATEVST